ncbi:unnamed protein product, partial [Brugia timori]|uniref:Ovule protein n=1 Tax=Brugia timori TaxID=42155 RepID=A0A0R3QP37_9BILA
MSHHLLIYSFSQLCEFIVELLLKSFCTALISKVCWKMKLRIVSLRTRKLEPKNSGRWQMLFVSMSI